MPAYTGCEFLDLEAGAPVELPGRVILWSPLNAAVSVAKDSINHMICDLLHFALNDAETEKEGDEPDRRLALEYLIRNDMFAEVLSALEAHGYLRQHLYTTQYYEHPQSLEITEKIERARHMAKILDAKDAVSELDL